MYHQLVFLPSLLFLSLISSSVFGQTLSETELQIVVQHEDWELIGDLLIPNSAEPMPAVLMLNQAAGDRHVYADLAQKLADRGIASLRLDLRGHGSSTNLGTFTPGQHRRDPLIWDAEKDVPAAVAYLKNHPKVDADRIGIVGASYSGEESAEAGRLHEYVQVYVMLSPGSFSEASIDGIDESRVPWLFITAKEDRFLQEISKSLEERSETVEFIRLPGKGHATNLLDKHTGLAERIAVWLAAKLAKLPE